MTRQEYENPPPLKEALERLLTAVDLQSPYTSVTVLARDLEAVLLAHGKLPRVVRIPWDF